MATYTEQIPEYPIHTNKRRPMAFVPISAKPTTRNFVRRRVRPLDRQSPPQLALRALTRFAKTILANCSEEQYALWAAKYYETPTPLRLAAIVEHLQRWTAMHAPAQIPDASTAASSLIADMRADTPTPRAVRIRLQPNADTNLFGIVLLRDTIPIIFPAWSNAILFSAASTTAVQTYLDTPLRPGTYHYRAACFETTGQLGPFYSDTSVTVT